MRKGHKCTWLHVQGIVIRHVSPAFPFSPEDAEARTANKTPRPSKLEKADILEMTVDYIKKMADRKPESTDKESLTDKAATPGRGMPFLNGFSRCLEEVDMFLNTQLPLQPDVRHKVLSHCREQLSAKDLTLEHTLTPQNCRSSSLSSPGSAAEDLPGSRHLSDSDLASEDEEKPKQSVDGGCVEVTQAASESPPAATATAFVAPFLHTSSLVSCAEAQHSSSSTSQTSGIKLGGPLKLICGGNVFIVVDQQQQQQPVSNCVTVATGSMPPQPSPLSLSGQVICNPHTYPASGVPAYISAVGLPQMNSFTTPSLGLPVASFPVTGSVPACTLKASCTDLTAGSLLTLHGSAQSGLSPPFVPLPEESPNRGNDINNNVVNMHAVWRPW
ncbi:hypothetical protein ACOMHN_043920 [Nucella lapillus]